MKFQIEPFTLECTEQPAGEKYDVKITGKGNTDFIFAPPFAHVIFSSQGSSPQFYSFGTYGNDYIYLPHESLQNESYTIGVPKAVIERILESFKVLNGSKIKKEYKEKVLKCLKPGMYYHWGMKAGQARCDKCKETLLFVLAKTTAEEFAGNRIVITETLPPNKIQWLKDVQKKIPKKDRFTFKPFDDRYYEFHFPVFWHEQLFYRMGWALLMIRMAMRDKKLVNYSSGDFVIKEKLQEKITAFEKGKFSITDETYKNKWTHNTNWLSKNEFFYEEDFA